MTTGQEVHKKGTMGLVGDPKFADSKLTDSKSTDPKFARILALEPKLRAGFLARYGPEVGDEVTAECLAWAWENSARLDSVVNPVAYLFRVGQSRSRRLLIWKRERARFPIVQTAHDSTLWIEPSLPDALARLHKDQRTAVVLVHCLQWSYVEVATLLDVPLHTVRNLVHRGMTRLRKDLGVQNESR